MGARTLIAAAIAVALSAAFCACSGPRATATETRVHPSARPGFYRVETRLVSSGGRGQVEVTVRLKNKQTGRVVTQAQPVDVEPRDHTDLAIEIAAPPGDYTADVSVQYPPR